MKSQLIPPPDLAPPSVKHLSMAEKIELWKKLCDDEEKRLLAFLKKQIGPDGDSQLAYRDWLEKEQAEHDRAMISMLMDLSWREKMAAFRRQLEEMS